MNGYLKQSTASQVRKIGPFVDDTDFKTLETALSIANTDVKISKNGGTAASKNSGGATADSTTGLYHLTWDATDTNTVGELYFSIKVSGSLAVFGSYTVLEEAVYDAIFAASAVGYVADQPVNVTKWAGTSTTTGDIALKTTLAKTTHITGFNDLSAAQVNTEADTALADVGVTTTVTGRIDAAVSTRASQTSLDTVDDYVDTEVAAIKAVTDKLDTTFETDGSNYRFTQAALINSPSGSNPNGNVLLWEIWRWTTSTAPTATGAIRADTSDWSLATSIKINYTNLAGTNFATYIGNIRINDVIRVQRESNANEWQDYRVTSTGTDNTTWREIPVTRMSGSGVTPLNGNNVLVVFFREPTPDWSDTEKAQIRHRLGLDGTASAPVSGDPSLPDAADIAQINTKLDTIDDFVDTELTAVKAKTDQLTFTTPGFVDASATISMSSGDLNSIADALLKRDWNSVTGEAAYSALNAFRILRNVWNTSGGTLTVKKEDGTTTAWTRTLTTDPTAQPITGAS